ncbi:MAG: glycoside hydrolase family 2 TIM barrel-domain containing protein [Verrucomicrobiota bacterium]
MNKRIVTAVVWLGLFAGSGYIHAESARSKDLFDYDWRFASGDVAGAEAPAFDDAAWRRVDLPHDFSIEGPFTAKDIKGAPMNGYRPLGIGWYRKSFVTPPNLAGRRMWLEFEGVYCVAKVWVNGQLLTEHRNGYLGFACDLTPFLNPAGQPNILAVSADNRAPDTSRWYTGGGIYRHVWQMVSGDVHVARYGTYVTTPKITDAEARVDAQTEVWNESGADMPVVLTSEVLDPSGKAVASAKTELSAPKGGRVVFNQQFAVPQPQRWDLETPRLYRLVSRVRSGGQETDVYATTFGIREIRITPDGFFLNGRRQFLKGFCIHHDNGCLGASAFDRAIERRLEIIKEIGCNAVRLSHNPHATAMLDFCDRMGLLVYDEAFDKWNDQFYAGSGLWGKFWEKDLTDFVRRDRNHPSVFIWSVGNEVWDGMKAPDYGVNQLKAMMEVVHKLEPSRPVTTALFPMRKDGGRSTTKDHPNWQSYPPHQMGLVMDVMSANYMENFFTRDRLQYPELRYIASESSSKEGGRPAWNSLDRDHAVGLFYWGGINYLGEANKWPSKGWTAGFVDRTGFRRPASWDVQSYFSGKPMVHIMVLDNRPQASIIWNEVKTVQNQSQSHWNLAGQADVRVEVFSNCEEIELFLNGRSLGVKLRVGEPGVGPRLTWDVPFAPGALLAVARNGGKEVARHEIKTAGAPKALRLTPDRAELRDDGQDLSHITVEIVDAQGVVVPDAKQRIIFKVSGAGTNAGVDNDDPTTEEFFQGDQRTAFGGRALLVVRSKRQPGEIAVEATAEGLESANLKLQTKTVIRTN